MAVLDGKPFTVADWLREMAPETRQSARTTRDRLRTLDQLFESRVLLLGAENSGIGTDSLVASRIENARRQILINAYLEKTLRPRARADSGEIAAWYASHPEDYRIKESVTVRHIQVATLKEAQKVRTLLQLKQREFADLSKELSTDAATKDNGGSLGTVTRDGFFAGLGREPALAETLLALKEGEYSHPVQLKDAWHVFRVDTHEPERLQPLDAVRDQIRGRLEREKIRTVYTAHLDELRAKFGWKVDSAVVGDSALFQPSAAELFRQAQGTTDPQTRIRMYEELMSLYPGSNYCDQAQFMIAFVYSEELSDYDRAEQEFKKLVTNYPKSELVKSAQWMLENMRKNAPQFDLPDSLPAPPAGKSEGKPGK
ncbi:MAG: peptidyl-prolyl cis-trans isomerase [Candidatus Eisenbacteria bacterium]|nr:peptidyl-prolyl cis-trans isomerase [Candidatus Eisenbacteria bacterium]